MSDRLRTRLALIVGVLVLIAVHVSIYQRERIVADGRTVLLRLAPVDPRSLMQGDYMALRFELFESIRDAVPEPVADGKAVLALDAHRVASFVRVDDGAPLAGNETLMRYRVRDGKIKLATNAFFFQEGAGRVYEAAEFGEFRVNPHGDAILTHLRDEDRHRLGRGSMD